MVAAGVPSSHAKRPFAAFVATSADGLRREVSAEARRRGLPADVDVDDVVQTAYVKLLPVYERLDTEYAAFNYAHKTAVRALNDLRRRERVRHEGWLETVYRRHHRAPMDPEDEAIRALRAADVRKAFGRLPLSQRRAVALVDVEELRQSEAADVMGVSPTVLKGLVQRGRERLRRDLAHAPGLVALFRFRRRELLAPAAAAPAFTVMAALLLTVGQAPWDPNATPYVADTFRPAPIVRMVAPTVLAAAPRQVPRQVAANPVARPARPPKAPPVKRKKQLPAPPAGACLTDALCLGDHAAGDAVCVRRDITAGEPVCVSQSVVEVCPLVAPGNPVVTCSTDADYSSVPEPPNPDEEL